MNSGKPDPVVGKGQHAELDEQHDVMDDEVPEQEIVQLV
jgi:hypothetical protein